MCKSGMGLIRGVVLGMTSGVLIGASLCCMMKNPKKIKRKADKAVHAVGDLVGQVPYMFK